MSASLDTEDNEFSAISEDIKEASRGVLLINKQAGQQLGRDRDSIERSRSSIMEYLQMSAELVRLIQAYGSSAGVALQQTVAVVDPGDQELQKFQKKLDNINGSADKSVTKLRYINDVVSSKRNLVVENGNKVISQTEKVKSTIKSFKLDNYTLPPKGNININSNISWNCPFKDINDVSKNSLNIILNELKTITSVSIQGIED